MSPLTVLVTSIFGGLLALERRAFLQAMASRPLVAATATGALLDDVVGGLMVGLVFELFHLGGASLGGAHPDHDTLPAVMGAALTAGMADAAGSDSTPALWSVAILICAPFGRAGLLLENRLDSRARKYFTRATTAASSGDLKKAARQNLRAMWPQFVFYGLLCGSAALIGPHLERFLVHDAPLQVLRGLAWAFPAMGVAAAAIAVHGSHAPKFGRIAITAVLVTVTALLVLGRWE
ncbi:MAG: PTS sugar transporter subunit IIC [Archangium sp.]